MPIVSNLQNLVIPGVYLLEVTPNPAVIAQGAGVVGIVGTSTYGPVNTPVSVATPTEFFNVFGDYSSAYGDGYLSVYAILSQGAPRVKFVRVTGTGATNASLLLTGAVSGNITLTANYVGTHGNNLSGKVENVISGNTQKVTIQVGNKQKVYTFTSGETITGLAQKINQDPDRLCSAATTGSQTLLATASLTAFSGGSNGVAVTANDRIGTESSTGATGHRVIDGDDEVDIVVSALGDTTTIADIISMASPSPNIKPRMGIVAFSTGTSYTSATASMSGYNTDHVQFFYGNPSIYNPWTQQYELFPVQLLAAGARASVAIQQSILNTTLKSLTPISGEYTLSNSQISSLISARINPLTPVAGKGWVWRADKTASANNALAQATRRRIVDNISRTLESQLDFVVGKNNIPSLRQDVLTAITTYFSGLSRSDDPNVGPVLGLASGGTPYRVVCDSSNNPDDVVRQNRLIVDMYISIPAVVEFLILRLDADIENPRISEVG